MTPRQQATLIAGVVAAIAAFIAWQFLGDSTLASIVYAALASVVAGGVTWWQKGNRA